MAAIILICNLLPVCTYAEEGTITGYVVGDFNWGYIVFSDGSESYCVEASKWHVDENARYVRDDQMDGSSYDSVFVAIAKADEKGMDHDGIRRTAQLAIWHIADPDDDRRGDVKWHLGNEYAALYDEMVSGSTEGYEIKTWGYHPTNKRGNDEYQNCISGYATPIREEEPEPTPVPEPTPELKPELEAQPEPEPAPAPVINNDPEPEPEPAPAPAEENHEENHEAEELKEEPKAEEPKEEEPKEEEPKAEEPKAEEPKAEEPEIEEVPVKTECQHDWDGGEVTKPATCKEEGIRTYTCRNCGEIKTEEIPKLSHEYEWVVTKEATTEEEGVKEYKCKLCGDVAKTESIPKLEQECKHEHKKKVTTTVATCCQREIADWYCEDCGELIRKGVIYYKDPSNHTNLQERVVRAATYDEPGILRHYCPDCGYEVDEEIPQLVCEHKRTCIYDDPVTGKSYVKCVDCKKLLEENTMPISIACSHSYPLEEVCVQKVDESHWGEYNYVCSHCKKVMSTEKVHPYKAYKMKDYYDNEVTVYGWFDEDYARKVFDLTNEYRVANGLNALKYNSDLQEASNLRALETAVYFSHSRPGGGSWNTVTSQWTFGGENIASGQTDPECVMRAWKNSEGHNKNLLYGKGAGQTPFKGLSVGCFHRLRFNNTYRPSVPSESLVWVQNFTFR